VIPDNLLPARNDYPDILFELSLCPEEMRIEAIRKLCRGDLFFLLCYMLNRPDVDNQWLFERCREAQAEPDDRLDLWAREHYKDLADTTPVLSGNRGWITHGELLVGDTVFNPDGDVVSVLAVTPRYHDSECYRLTFNTGEYIIAGAGHLWRLRDGSICTTKSMFYARLLHLRIDDEITVTRINYVASVPTRCIQVENDMYCVGKSMIPTHNSTIITFAKTIQDILIDPEITIGIFSHIRPIAKGFLRQIKTEFELNTRLQDTFPDILYKNPKKEALKWSEDDGICVKRTTNPNAQTVEAYGVVDGQPTGKHFSLLIYDDIVTLGSVSTPEMIEKTTDALRLSFNLGAHGGRRRFIGTRYHFADTYKTIMDTGVAEPRIHAATDDGSSTGQPVFLTDEQLIKKRRDFGVYVFSCQMLQNPIADALQGFKREWLRHYRTLDIERNNWYLLVDAANSKRKGSDYTSIWAVGLGSDGNYYAVPEVRDRLNLTERIARLISLHRKYKPVEVRYEQYGMQSDEAYIQTVMDREQYHFDIIEVAGPTSKEDRIKRLVPICENAQLYLPMSHNVTDYEGRTRDLVHDFIEQEFIPFPVPLHDDMLDALARITEVEGRQMGISDKKITLALQWPKQNTYIDTPRGASDWRM